MAAGGSMSGNAATAPEIAWFGGYRGAIAIETNLLHLVQDDGTTFCREPGILADATRRNLGNIAWCDVCVRECQKVRRDV